MNYDNIKTWMDRIIWHNYSNDKTQDDEYYPVEEIYAEDYRSQEQEARPQDISDEPF